MRFEVALTTIGGPHAGASPRTLRSRAEKMLRHLATNSGRGLLVDVELSIALVDDATIRTLNRSYRKKDKPTDVLAFPLQDLAPGWSGKARVSGALGDVVLSIPTARKQAAAHRRPLLDELTMLLAHGLLHLLGFDHGTDREEREMTARTRTLEAAGACRTPKANVKNKVKARPSNVQRP